MEQKSSEDGLSFLRNISRLSKRKAIFEERLARAEHRHLKEVKEKQRGELIDGDANESSAKINDKVEIE